MTLASQSLLDPYSFDLFVIETPIDLMVSDIFCTPQANLFFKYKSQREEKKLYLKYKKQSHFIFYLIIILLV